MSSHSKELSSLLQELNQEFDRSKRVTVHDHLVCASMQRSACCKLPPRLRHQPLEITPASSKIDLCGAIFMCNKRTWKECLTQCLFGLPLSKKSLVDKIVPGMKLFLFEYEHRQLWGVFEATSHGKMDIIPDAYTGGSFPCQVRVNAPEDCVALYEEEFYDALKENYFSDNKFHFNLSAEQVCHLMSLFESKYKRAKGLLIDYNEMQRLPERCYKSEDLSISPGSLNYYEDTDKFVPYPNAIIHGNGFPLDVDMTSVANIGCHLGNVVPLYSTVAKQETRETVMIPEHTPLLRSDRPIRKSVWERISGCAKPLVALESVVKQEKLPASSLTDVFTERAALEVESGFNRDEGIEEPLEEFFVGFKRRKVNSMSTSSNPNEIQTSKRRRKLARPCFEASADEASTEHATSLVPGSKVDILSESAAKPLLEEHNFLKTGICYASGAKEELMKTVVSNGKQAVQGQEIECQPNQLDLNFPSELQGESYLRSEQLSVEENFSSFVGKRGQELSTLALCMPTKDEERELEPATLSLYWPTQEVDSLLSETKKDIDLSTMRQNNTGAVASVQVDKHESEIHVENVVRSFLTSPNQLGKTDRKDVKSRSDAPGSTEQGLNLLPHMFLLGPDETDVSLAPCTPAKEAVCNLSPANKVLGDGQGRAVTEDAFQEIPLKLTLGNGTTLTVVNDETNNLGLDFVEVENGNEASGHGNVDEISSKQSETISVGAISGRTNLNSIDLRSIISGLQVSGVKLQLGSSPSLIFELGDENAHTNVDDQKGVTQV